MMNRLLYRAPLLALGALSVMAPAAYAAQEYLSIGLNEYFRFEADDAVIRTAVGNPEIADVILLPDSDTEFLVVGKKAGQTTLLVWLADGRLQEWTISIGAEDGGQAYAIQKAIGLPGVKVRVVSNGSDVRVLLEGTVKDQIEHDRAIKIARLYSGEGKGEFEDRGDDDDDFEYDLSYEVRRTYGKVIDLLTITAPTQIHLEAQIIEISADDAKNIGIQYKPTTGMTYTELQPEVSDTVTDPNGTTYDIVRQAARGFTSVTLGETGIFYGGEDFGGQHNTGFWLLDHFSRIGASINLLINEGKAKLLSRPSISTMSGSKAKIHIGGSMPFPKSDQNGNVTFEWRDYGIKLNIMPTLDGDDKITADVHAEVSAPDYTNVVTTTAGTVPSMRSRNAHSVVHITPGYTMVIGGLLTSEDQKNLSKIPLLSSIPIIGEFFKYRSSTNQKRELIILITPQVVNENTPANMSEKLKDWYDKNDKWAKSREKLDLNEDIKAEEAKAAEEAAAKEREEAGRKWREANERTAPRVKPANAWRHIEDADPATEATEVEKSPKDSPNVKPVEEKRRPAKPANDDVFAEEETPATSESRAGTIPARDIDANVDEPHDALAVTKGAMNEETATSSDTIEFGRERAKE